MKVVAEIDVTFPVTNQQNVSWLANQSTKFTYLIVRIDMIE